MLNENEAILKTRTDLVKKEKGTIERGKTVLWEEQFLKRGYSESIAKGFLSRFLSTLKRRRGWRAYVVLVLREAAC